MKKKNKFPFFRIKGSWNSLHIFLLGSVVGFLAAFISKEEISFNSTLFSKPSQIQKSQSAQPRLFTSPAHSPIIERIGYTLSYDGKNRVPKWVYEHLTENTLKGEAEIHRYRFQEDDRIPKHLRSTQDDYIGSEFKRAPLCPPDDQKASSRAMYDTFYLSNAVPELAKITMEQLERQVRLWAKKFKDLHVVSGPLFLPTENPDGNRYVNYRVIGPHDVAVPTHFYKVILAERLSGEIEMRAFLIPNEEKNQESSLKSYLVSVEEIERLSGLEFFRELRADSHIKARNPSSLW